MAIDALVSGLQGALRGYDYMKGFSDPLGEARVGLEARRLDALTPYYAAQTRQMSAAADQQELQAEMLRRQQRQQQADQYFAEFDSMAKEYGGYSRAMMDPGAQKLFSQAYNLNPAREEMGLPEIDGLEAIDEQNYELWGFTRDDFERMRAERGSEALFIPYRMHEGRREPVLEDLDGDGIIDAYGGEQLERIVRPFFMSGERAGREFGQLTGNEQLGGTVTIGGGGQPQAQPLAGGSVWERQIQAETNGRQFDDNGNPLISPAGAVGIAQVMPATGPEAARMAGLEWEEERFYNDADYNERLGRAYRNHLRERYNGDEVLATAAYNGGMGNVDEWIRRFGDPRTGEISHADFIRQIPFAETQGYVMKVLGGGQQPQQDRQPQQPLAEADTSRFITPMAIQSAGQVSGQPTTPRMDALQAEARQSQQVPANGPAPVMSPEDMNRARQMREGPQLGFESETEFKSALARRAVNQQGFGPGSASRAANDPAILDETRRNLTPGVVASSGQELLSGLERRDGRTYSVNSSSGRPTHKQIGHAYNMMARGLISREEFNRFIDTGTISEDGVALIERGMQEAAGIATAEIQQQGQTQREWLQQQGQTQRERIKQGDQRDTIEDFHSTMDVVGPSIYGMSQEDWGGGRGNAIKNELAQGIFRFNHELLGTPNDTHSLAQGHRRLLELEDKVNPKWWEWYDRIFKGEQTHNLSAMPSMQALAAMDSGLVADEASARRTLRSVERYREIMRAEGNPNVRDPRMEAQSLVNFYLGARQVGVNPHALDTDSVRYNNLMRIAIQAAQANRPVAEVLAEYAQGSAN